MHDSQPLACLNEAPSAGSSKFALKQHVQGDKHTCSVRRLTSHTDTSCWLADCTAAQTASRKAAAAAAVAEAAAQFEACRPSDPEPPAAAPWRFNSVSIHTVEHVDPPLGEHYGQSLPAWHAA
jgi:hypothetical protein